MKNPPPCPSCHKPPWREDHLSVLQQPDDRPEDRRFCVCMHCSAIWKLVDGQWTTPAPEDEEAVAMLRPYAMSFALDRALGIPVELRDELNRVMRPSRERQN